MKVDAGIALTIRVGAIFRMVFTIIFGALWILIKNKVRLLIQKIRNRKATKEELTAEDGVNSVNEVNNKENIQAEERNDDNGK